MYIVFVFRTEKIYTNKTLDKCKNVCAWCAAVYLGLYAYVIRSIGR